MTFSSLIIQYNFTHQAIKFTEGLLSKQEFDNMIIMANNNGLKYIITMRPFEHSITLKVFLDIQKLLLNLSSNPSYQG